MIEKISNSAEVKEASKDNRKVTEEAINGKIDSDKRLGEVRSAPKKDFKYNGLNFPQQLIGQAWGLPKEVLKDIYNFDELKHYRELKPIKFGETSERQSRFVLVPKELDIKNPVDSDGRTNVDRLKDGLAPIKDGKTLEAHHIGQKDVGNYAMLTKAEHTQNGFDKMLHDSSRTGVDHGRAFDQDKKFIYKSIYNEVKTDDKSQ